MSRVLNIKITLNNLKPSTVQSLQISQLEDHLQKLEKIIGSEKPILVKALLMNKILIIHFLVQPFRLSHCFLNNLV